jgi:hypothetical protein
MPINIVSTYFKAISQHVKEQKNQKKILGKILSRNECTAIYNKIGGWWVCDGVRGFILYL